MPRKPIAHTIRSSSQTIKAKVCMDAFLGGFIQPRGLVYIPTRDGDVIGTISAVDDGEISTVQLVHAATLLEQGKPVAKETQDLIYKVISIDPIGVINGDLREYRGTVIPLMPVYRAKKAHLERVYPSRQQGLIVGNIALGTEETDIPFVFSDRSLSAHTLVVGRNNSGKTNFMKVLAAANANRPEDERVATIVIGHPDIGLDNPNAETVGLLSLKHPNILGIGFDSDLKLHPSEIGLDEIRQIADWSPPQMGLIKYACDVDPNFVTTLAYYDAVEDPLKLMSGRKAGGYSWKLDTVRVIKMHLRDLAKFLDDGTTPVLNEIMKAMMAKKTVAINTFMLDSEQQAMFLKMLVDRIQRAGFRSMGRRKGHRIVIFMDEAQVFMSHLGRELISFLKQCRKAGVAIFLFTQNASESVPSEVKGEVHNVVALSLAPQHIHELGRFAPELLDLADIIQRRPIGEYKGLASVLVTSQFWPVVVKTAHFEANLARFQPPADTPASAPPAGGTDPSNPTPQETEVLALFLQETLDTDLAPVEPQPPDDPGTNGVTPEYPEEAGTPGHTEETPPAREEDAPSQNTEDDPSRNSEDDLLESIWGSAEDPSPTIHTSTSTETTTP